MIPGGLTTAGPTTVGFSAGRPYDPFIKIYFYFNFFYFCWILFDSCYINSLFYNQYCTCTFIHLHVYTFTATQHHTSFIDFTSSQRYTYFAPTLHISYIMLLSMLQPIPFFRFPSTLPTPPLRFSSTLPLTLTVTFPLTLLLTIPPFFVTF